MTWWWRPGSLVHSSHPLRVVVRISVQFPARQHRWNRSFTGRCPSGPTPATVLHLRQHGWSIRSWSGPGQQAELHYVVFGVGGHWVSYWFGSCLCVYSVQAFDETSPLRPSNPYSATKAAAEYLVRSYWDKHKVHRSKLFIYKCVKPISQHSVCEYVVSHHHYQEQQHLWAQTVHRKGAVLLLLSTSPHPSTFPIKNNHPDFVGDSEVSHTPANGQEMVGLTLKGSSIVVIHHQTEHSTCTTSVSRLPQHHPGAPP